MKQITDKIYAIDASMGEPIWAGLNAFLLKGEKQNYLIDAGIPGRGCREHIISELETVGLTPADCDLIITHFHPDHVGDALKICDPGRKIYMPRKSYEFWKKTYDRSAVHAHLTEDGWPEICHVSFAWVSYFFNFEDKRIEFYDDGDKFPFDDDDIKAILTPGHTMDEMCFYMEKAKILFSGDHLLFKFIPILEISLEAPEILRHYLDSLKKLKNLDISMVLPGHFEGGDPYARIDEILGHAERKLQRAYEKYREYSVNFMKENPGKPAPRLTAYEVGCVICGTPSFTNCDTINKLVKARSPIQAIMPYIYELALTGKFKTSVEKGVRLYEMAPDELARD